MRIVDFKSKIQTFQLLDGNHLRSLHAINVVSACNVNAAKCTFANLTANCETRMRHFQQIGFAARSCFQYVFVDVEEILLHNNVRNHTAK